jgi:hypothetical protein
VLKLEELDNADVEFICDAEELMISRMPNCESKWWISKNHGHKEGYGPFYHKKPMASGSTLLEAYLNYKLEEARQTIATRNPKANHIHLDQTD